jgi:hypothetical protein
MRVSDCANRRLLYNTKIEIQMVKPGMVFLNDILILKVVLSEIIKFYCSEAIQIYADFYFEKLN